MNAQDRAKLFLLKLKDAALCEAALKAKQKESYQLMQELYEAMEEEGVEKITLDGIDFKPTIEQDFALAGDLKGQKWDECEVWFAWLKQIGEAGLIRTKESVPWNTRKKFLKEFVEAKQPLPQFIEETFQPAVKYNKTAVRRLAGVEGGDDGEAV